MKSSKTIFLCCWWCPCWKSPLDNSVLFFLLALAKYEFEGSLISSVSLYFSVLSFFCLSGVAVVSFLLGVSVTNYRITWKLLWSFSGGVESAVLLLLPLRYSLKLDSDVIEGSLDRGSLRTWGVSYRAIFCFPPERLRSLFTPKLILLVLLALSMGLGA